MNNYNYIKSDKSYIKFDLRNNLLNFEEIQKVLYYDGLKYFPFIRTDHPEYLKIKELYGFLTI